MKSPEIDNYTADKATVDEVTGLTAEDEDSEVTVTYSPEMETTIETEEVNQTIHYVYEDGSKAADDHTDKVTFTRDATKNLATGEITYGKWIAQDNDTTFSEVFSPEIEHCTADDTCIEETTNIQPDTKDLEFTVIYKANTETKEERDEVSRTIHYVFEDGTKAVDSHTETLIFTRNATKNLMTGKVTYSEWVATNEDTTFDEVKSPEIDGFTADHETVKEQTGMTAGDKDSEVTVTYKKDTTAPSTDPSDSPTEPTKPEVTKTSTTKVSVNQSVTNKQSLPKTGEERTSYALYSGLVLIAAALLGIFVKRSKRNVK